MRESAQIMERQEKRALEIGVHCRGLERYLPSLARLSTVLAYLAGAEFFTWALHAPFELASPPVIGAMLLGMLIITANILSFDEDVNIGFASAPSLGRFLYFYLMLLACGLVELGFMWRSWQAPLALDAPVFDWLSIAATLGLVGLLARATWLIVRTWRARRRTERFGFHPNFTHDHLVAFIESRGRAERGRLSESIGYANLIARGVWAAVFVVGLLLIVRHADPERLWRTLIFYAALYVFIIWWILVALSDVVLNRLHRSARRAELANAPADPAAIDEEFVLFLRSFDRDEETVPFCAGEEQARAPSIDLLEQIIHHGRWTLGIGAPGTNEQPLSFKRYWIDDADSGDAGWQGSVRDLITRADLIVILGGNTPGVLWELAEIREAQALERMLYFFPADLDAHEVNRPAVATALGLDPSAVTAETRALCMCDGVMTSLTSSAFAAAELTTSFAVFWQAQAAMRK